MSFFPSKLKLSETFPRIYSVHITEHHIHVGLTTEYPEEGETLLWVEKRTSSMKIGKPIGYNASYNVGVTHRLKVC